jgi:hypothetical protein
MQYSLTSPFSIIAGHIFYPTDGISCAVGKLVTFFHEVGNLMDVSLIYRFVELPGDSSEIYKANF